MSTTDDTPSLKTLIEPASEQAPDAGYIMWKEGKIRAALKQAEKRDQMIPAEKVWSSFGFKD